MPKVLVKDAKHQVTVSVTKEDIEAAILHRHDPTVTVGVNCPVARACQRALNKKMRMGFYTLTDWPGNLAVEVPTEVTKWIFNFDTGNHAIKPFSFTLWVPEEWLCES